MEKSIKIIFSTLVFMMASHGVGAQEKDNKLEYRKVSAVIPIKKKTSALKVSPLASLQALSSATSGCMGESEWDCGAPSVDPILLFEEAQRLPDVEITARAWDDGWTTLCRGLDCVGFELVEAKDLSGDSLSVKETIKEAIVKVSEVRNKSEDACTSIAASGVNGETAALARNTTSEKGSSDSDREMAAKAIWGMSPERVKAANDIASASPSTWLGKVGYVIDSGFTVTITYADGGTEEYKYQIYSGNGDLQRVAGSLKPGTGTSKCPK